MCSMGRNRHLPFCPLGRIPASLIVRDSWPVFRQWLGRFSDKHWPLFSLAEFGHMLENDKSLFLLILHMQKRDISNYDFLENQERYDHDFFATIEEGLWIISYGDMLLKDSSIILEIWTKVWQFYYAASVIFLP